MCSTAFKDDWNPKPNKKVIHILRPPFGTTNLPDGDCGILNSAN